MSIEKMPEDPLRIAVCEDDAAEAEALKKVLDSSGIPCEAVFFPNGAPFVRDYYPGKYDLVFMDIYMPGLGGLETVEEIRSMDPDVPIAFLTSSQDHALEGYRLHVNRYILKPLRENTGEVMEVLGLAEKARADRPALHIRQDGEEIALRFEQIVFLEQDNHLIRLVLSNGSQLSFPGKLDSLEEELPKPVFFRCHKSFLVNLAHVKGIDKELCVFAMDAGGVAHIRRRSLRDAQEAYSQYMFDCTRSQ